MQQRQQAEQTFPLVGIAMSFLRKNAGGKERLLFCRQGQEALKVGLEALFSSGKPAAPALGDLLGLAAVLEGQLGSPSAAALIRSAVRRNGKALRALGIDNRDHALTRRSTTRLIGQKARDQAPVFGAAMPKGAISLSTLIDPMQFDRARALKIKQASTTALPERKVPAGSGPNRRRFG